jgi:hypothetical protein
MAFATGDRVQLTKTDKAQGLENGCFGVIEHINPKTKILTLRMDNNEQKEVNPASYDGLRHGYAATIYKAQGSTLDHVYVLHGKTTNQSTNYVALTRQTTTLSLYVSQDETPAERDLIYQMGRSTGKGTSLTFDTEKDIEDDKLKIFEHQVKHGVEDIVTKVKDTFHRNKDFYQFEKSNRRRKSPSSSRVIIQGKLSEIKTFARTTLPRIRKEETFLQKIAKNAFPYKQNGPTFLCITTEKDSILPKRSVVSPSGLSMNSNNS